MREYHARSTINIIVCAGERAQLLFLMDIRAGKQMRERGPRGKANGGKGVLAGKQMLGSLGFDIFSSPDGEYLSTSALGLLPLLLVFSICSGPLALHLLVCQ